MWDGKVMKRQTKPILILIIFLLTILPLIYFSKILIVQSDFNSQIQNVARKEVETELNQYKTNWLKKSFPTLSVVEVTGENTQLISKGNKPKIYVLWASWCPDCQRELPLIEKLYQNYKNQIDIVTINLVGFREETMEQAKKYYDEEEFTFPMYFDLNQSVFKLLEVKAIPTLYLVNEEGVVENIFIESVSQNILNQQVLELTGQ